MSDNAVSLSKAADALREQSHPAGERDYLFDNLKALLIFLVASVHFCAAVRSVCGPSPLMDFLMMTACSFHMPLFMVISGYFSKKVRREKMTDTLLVYLTAQALFFVYDWCFTYGMSLRHVSLTRVLSPGFSMWYLFALIVLRLLHPELTRLRYAVPVLAAVSILVMGCSMDTAGRQAIVKTVAHAVYFVIGVRLTPETVARLRRFPKAVYAAGLAAGMAVMYLLTGVLRLVQPNTLRLMMIRAIPTGAFGGSVKAYGLYAFVLVLALYMCVMLTGLMPSRRTVVSVFGQNTVTVYIAQAFVYLLLRAALVRGGAFAPRGVMYGGAVLLAALCVPVCGSRQAAGCFSRWIRFIKRTLFAASTAA